MEGDSTYITTILHHTSAALLALITLSLMAYGGYEADLLTIPAVLVALPQETLHAMTGNLLGDGSIRYPNLGRDKQPSGNTRYEMTMSAAALGYMTMLYNRVYAPFSASGLKG